MKLRDRFNDAKETIKIVEKLEISKKQRLLADVLSYLSALIFCIPFTLIFISLVKTNSLIMPSYYVIMGLIVISIMAFTPVVIIVNIEILKAMLPDNEVLQSIKYKNIYLKEFLNPITFVIVVAVIVFINLLFWGVI